MKKNDMIMIGIIAVIALAVFAGVNLYGSRQTKDARAVVTVNGEVYGSYPLSENAKIKIDAKKGAYNLMVIEDGAASIEEATCPDKICVRHKPVDKMGETLVCLPNQVVVEIVSSEEASVDAETN